MKKKPCTCEYHVTHIECPCAYFAEAATRKDIEQKVRRLFTRKPINFNAKELLHIINPKT